MKLSEYHKSHGLSGTIRAFDTNTEIHFSFEKGKTRTGVELNMGGHCVEGYLEIAPVPTKDPNAEFDIAIQLVAGPRPAADYQPSPKVTGGSTKPVSTPEPTFELPAAPPGLVPIPERRSEPARYDVVDKFDPGPAPPAPEPAVVEEREPDTAKVATIISPDELKSPEGAPAKPVVPEDLMRDAPKEPEKTAPKEPEKEAAREERKGQAPRAQKPSGRR